MSNKFKKNLLLGFAISLLVACGNNNASSKSNNSNSNNNSTSSFKDTASTSSLGSNSNSSSINVNVDDYTFTISEFSTYLGLVSYELEANETVSATREITQVEQQAYAIETMVINEELNAYEGPYAIINGSEDITYVSTDFILGDDYEGFQPKRDTYIVFRGLVEDTYYEIEDYGNGKDRDYAAQYSIGKQISEQELPWRASMQASYFVDYYLYDLFGTYISLEHELVPTVINNGADLEYKIEFSMPSQDSYGMVYAKAEITFVMSTDGFVKEYNYLYSETARNYDDTGALGDEYLSYSIKDVCNVERGNKQKPLDKLPITPSDYWLQSYDVQIIATLIDDVIECENDEIPVGYYISAQAVNIYPEKALDTDLSIINSSNNDVINISEYGVIKSLKGGKTELTISSSAGIIKTIEASVFEEVISEILVKVYATHLYVGETYGVYEFITPENAVDSIDWSVDNEDVATITVDDRGYASLVCHSTGTVTITATSVKNPNAIGTTTVTVTEKLDEQTLKSLVTSKSWTNVKTPEDVITFNEDGTGTITFIDLVSRKQGTYEFEWIFAEYSEDEGLLISMTTMVGEYDASFCILSLNGNILEVNLYHQDPDLWAYQYQGDFAHN